MKDSAMLRAKAADKRRMAALARRVAPGLTQAQDRLSILRTAQEFESEAAELEAQADVLDLANPSA
jgi:hypothetical protein